MLEFHKSYSDSKKILDELLIGNGVVVFRDVFPLDQINEARAIYFGAKILILDEPTSALGQKQQMEVLKTIKDVQKLGHIAIILITHNEIHARLISDRYTFLSLGEVIGRGMAEELGGDDIKRLMAGGAEIGDLRDELGA